MNIIDKIIEPISPQMYLNRQIARKKMAILNSGYDESGASHTKKSMIGATSVSGNPNQDINDNLDTLRNRSRQLFMNGPIATSAIKTNRTNVVGSGLKLKCRIDHETLGLTEEEAAQWEKKTEKEFELWAESKFSDATMVNNFYEQQQLALMSWLLNGDGWGLVRNREPTVFMPYSICIHLIEADRISTPLSNSSMNAMESTTGKGKNGNRIFNGVEVDKHGAIVAYHISDYYPNDMKMRTWQRVEAFGKVTGNPNVIQLMESERCEQYRGVPYLAPVIETLRQITRYTNAELTAAVITAFFTAFIKQTGPTNENPFGEAFSEEDRMDDADETTYEMGAGTINVLGVNEDVVIADPKRPASGFDGFVTAMMKQIGAALEIPYELLTKSFLSSYSASRAALLEAWKAFRMRRTWFANDFCQPIYDMWLSEAVAIGRIKAPGFFNDPLIKKAWCSAEWVGPSPGQIDPVKEVNASILRVNQGFSTREKETMELTGGNYADNVRKLAKENEMLMTARGGEEDGKDK